MDLLAPTSIPSSKPTIVAMPKPTSVVHSVTNASSTRVLRKFHIATNTCEGGQEGGRHLEGDAEGLPEGEQADGEDQRPEDVGRDARHARVQFEWWMWLRS